MNEFETQSKALIIIKIVDIMLKSLVSIINLLHFSALLEHF